MTENKGPTSFMKNYEAIIEKIKSGKIIRNQYGGNNDSTIYLSQAENISEEERNNLIKKINKN